MDPAQLVLLIIISVLTLLLLFIGIQVFLVLREVRRAMLRVNVILDEVETAASSVMEPLSNLSSTFSGMKAAASLFSMFVNKTHKHTEE